jgi:DNA-binding NtrC family response regulator
MAGRLLVIATDEDLRRSLAFSLAAHGYVVETLADPSQAGQQGHIDCTIVDEDVAQALGPRATAFFRQHAPVVLLHYNSPSIEVARSLQKPLRGDDIVQAVATAIHAYADRA